MIIPIRCFTCNHVLADKWNWYVDACKNMQDDVGVDESGSKRSERNEIGAERSESGSGQKAAAPPKPKNMEPTGRGELLDKLGLKRLCCRRHLLGHVDMMDLI